MDVQTEVVQTLGGRAPSYSCGFQLLPLGEFMKKIEIEQYMNIGCALQHIIDYGKGQKESAVMGKDYADDLIKDSLLGLKSRFSALEMDASGALVDQTIDAVKRGSIRWIQASVLFHSLRTVAGSEMAKAFAGFIPAGRAKYWGLEKPFGGLVHENFPSARQDAKSAGSCYAIEQYDACVFHLMRVAEKGLLVLAKDRKLKLLHNAPVAWSEWQKIISAVEIEAKKITNTVSRGTKKDKLLEFYSGALGEIISFKDTYRNYVMHGRETYDIHQAAGAYDRVGDFMKRLAARLTEVKK